MGNQEVYAPAGLTLGTGSQVLAYCCSRGLLLASVVGQAHCCSVVIVQHFNTVGQSTLKSSIRYRGLNQMDIAYQLYNEGNAVPPSFDFQGL